MSVEPVLLSIRQAAYGLRRDRRVLAQRIREAQLQPSGARLGHPVYRLRDLLKIERQHAGDQDPEKMKPFAQLAHYRAESQLHRVNAMRSELLTREDVDAEWARVRAIIDSELDTIVDEIRRDVTASPRIRAQIAKTVDDARSHLQERV